MSIVSNVFGLVRLAFGLKAFLHAPISIHEAKAVIKRGMQRRQEAFLETVERAIFSRPKSPYFKLFRAAGCELGDVRKLAGQEGVEETLRKLVEAGIYVTYEEFKGQRPLRRGSQTFAVRDSDFDNPLITTYYRSSSGGTRGRSIRVRVDLDHISQSAPHWAIMFDAHNLLNDPLVLWTTPHAGIANRQLMCAKFGRRFVKWFVFLRMGTLMDRLVSTGVHALVRRAAGFSKSQFVPLGEAWKVGEYLLGMCAQGLKPCLITSPSAAVRICLAMQKRKISCEGVTFILGAEPLTQSRRTIIEASGAKAIATYGFSEGGGVGVQCPTPFAADDVHVFMDAFAVIQRGHSPVGDERGDALLFTALRPACPKIMLNAEIGDSAVMETERCGCVFDELGYFQHLHAIRSFEKLTGEGMTVRGADLYHIMEDVLPKRFGGAAGHYQLIEEQGRNGLVRYQLVISPEAGALDEKAVLTVFMRELCKIRSQYRHMTDLWLQADLFQVIRKNPIVTGLGKVLPFRTLDQ